MIKALFFPIDGKPQLVEVDNSSDTLILQQLHNFIGVGLLQCLPVVSMKVHAYIDDEGKLPHRGPMPLNRYATNFMHSFQRLWHDDWIAGPMIVLGENGDLEDTIPEAILLLCDQLFGTSLSNLIFVESKVVQEVEDSFDNVENHKREFRIRDGYRQQN